MDNPQLPACFLPLRKLDVVSFWLAIVNHVDCCSKCQSRGADAKVTRGRSDQTSLSDCVNYTEWDI
jgi:hypothetical protein